MKQSKGNRTPRKFSAKQLAAGVAIASVIGLGTTVVNAESLGSHGTMMGQGGMNQNSMSQGSMGQGSMGQGSMGQGMMAKSGMGQGMMAKGGMGQGMMGQRNMGQSMMGHGYGMQPGQFIEGRLAFLKAELGITKSQKEAWDKFSGFARAQAEALKSEIQQRQAKWQKKAHNNTGDQANKSPLDHMQARISHMQERTARMQAKLDAMKNLYTALTPEQQVKAKSLLGRHLM